MTAHISCFDCDQAADYNEFHDAYFCSFCDIWLEPYCSDEDCTFCVTRPMRPSQLSK